jgi:hypothetical protein
MTTDPFTAAGPPPSGGRGQAEDRGDGVPRDYRGGYVLPGLDGSPPLTYKNGNPIGRVRASTVKSVTTDKTGIQKWQKEMIVRGLAKDPDLVAEAMKAVTADDKTRIREVGEQAFKVGGGKIAADRGSEFHEVTEKIKKGEQITPDQISDKIVARDVDAYLQVLAEVNLRPVPGMQERVVLLDHGGGGTFDDMFEWFNPDTEAYELLIGDTKTGKEIWEYGSLEIIVQLKQYVHALAIWRAPKDGGPAPWGDYIPMPNVSKHHVAIVHAPQNGTAEAFIVDITGAEEVVEAALTIRRWRADAKHRVRSIGRVDLREASFVAPTGPTYNETAQVNPTGPTTLTAGTAGHDSMMNTVAQIEDMAKGPDLSQPDGVWKPVGVATPNQIEQERIRDARLAKLSAVTNPNTEGDDESVEARAERNHRANAATRNGPVEPEINPDTGRKRRACGYCRKPGHTQKNCPENPESPKYSPPRSVLPGTEYPTQLSPAETQSMDQHAAVAPALNGDVPKYQVGDTVTVGGIDFTKHSEPTVFDSIMLPGADGPILPRETVTEQSAFGTIDVERQYCPGTHNAGWTQRADMPGLSVCASCNLPTKLHAEAMALTRAQTRTQAAYTPGLTVNGQPAVSFRPPITDTGDPNYVPAAPPSYGFPTAPVARPPADLISQSISQAQTQPEVLNIRQASIDAGKWSEQYEREARERYEAIVPAWGTTP